VLIRLSREAAIFFISQATFAKIFGLEVSHCFSLAAGVRQGWVFCHHFCLQFLLIWLLKELKHLTSVAILNAYAVVFFSTPMINCFLLLQSLDYRHYYVPRSSLMYFTTWNLNYKFRLLLNWLSRKKCSKHIRFAARHFVCKPGDLKCLQSLPISNRTNLDALINESMMNRVLVQLKLLTSLVNYDESITYNTF